MQYEFELFDKLILELSRPFIIQNKNLDEYIAIFKERCDSFYNIIVANFKRNSKGIVLNSKKTICSLHPEFDKINREQLSLFQDNFSEIIDAKALKALKLNANDILNCAFNSSASADKIYIKIKCSPERLQLNEARYYYHSLILKDEVRRIKKSINDSVFKLQSKEEIEHYIHKLQQSLINLSLRVSKMFNAEKMPNIYKAAEEFNDKDIVRLVYDSIEELLRFFEVSFFKYIDQNIEVPYRSELAQFYKLDEKLEVVKSALLESNIDSELMNLIYKPFLELSVITFPDRISYKKLIYSNTFLSVFFDEVQEGSKKLSYAIIIDYLYRCNFNSILIFNYKVNLIKIKLAEYPDSALQIDYLYHCLKITNQRQCRAQIAYDPDLPSLKVQLINWLEEEISYLNKKVSLNKQQPGLFEYGFENRQKILSGLSVPQLAHFYKLLYEVGVIAHDNQSDIIRFLSENFETAKTKNISVDSLKNKFYYSEEATVEPLKDYVIKLLNKLKY